MPTGPSLSEIPWKIADLNFPALWDPWFAAYLFCFGSHASQSGPIFNFSTDSGRYGPQFLESIKKKLDHFEQSYGLRKMMWNFFLIILSHFYTFCALSFHNQATQRPVKCPQVNFRKSPRGFRHYLGHWLIFGSDITAPSTIPIFIEIKLNLKIPKSF